MAFSIEDGGFRQGEAIPGQFAFCIPADQGHVSLAPNKNPRIQWRDAPAGTKSFAVLCIDADAPTVPDTVNKEGETVPAILARAEFSHWVLVDIAASTNL